MSFQVQGQHCVYRFLFVTSLFFDLVVNSIKPDKRIVALQWALLPLIYLVNDFICNDAYGCRGNADTVKLFNMTGNISIAHAKAEHR